MVILRKLFILRNLKLDFWNQHTFFYKINFNVIFTGESLYLFTTMNFCYAHLFILMEFAQYK